MKQFTLILALWLCATLTLQGQPGNYLVNGGFEDDFRGWSTYSDQAAGANVAFSLESGAAINGAKSAKLDITGAGTEPFHAALEQRFTIHKGQEVEVMFKVKASAATFMNFEVCRAYGDFNPIIRSTANLVATNDLAVTTEVQTVRFKATSPYSDANYKMSFLVGNIPGNVTIWIDNVVIRQTQSPWDGNILPNSELDEIFPRDASLPAFRTAQLTFSPTPWFDGGWEGGFADPAVSGLDVVFGVDSSSKLSGRNSFYFNVNNKPTTDFWHGFNFIFFWAHQGETYEYSFDVVASQNASFSSAMNEEPWGAIGDHFFLNIPATTDSQHFTIQTTRPLDNTMLHKIFQANLPSGTNYQIYFDNVRLSRLGAADTGSVTSIDRQGFRNVKVYPNPAANGRFSVELTDMPALEGASVQATLLGLEGREVLRREVRVSGGRLELETGLPTGAYVLRLQSGQYIFMKKVLVQ